jgi:flagellar biosynthetic protein FliO
MTSAPSDAAGVNPRLDEGPSLGRLFVQMTVALGVVFALMAGVLWAARRWLPQVGGRSSRNNAIRGIEVLATRPIGQRRSLMLVRIADRTLLLGVTPQSIQALTEMEPEPSFADGAPDPARWRAAAREAGLDEAAAPASRGTTALESR